MGRPRLYAHIRQMRERRHGRRQAGLCPYCGRPQTSGTASCLSCRQQRAGTWRAWKARQRSAGGPS
jgi:hypothetical protein